MFTFKAWQCRITFYMNYVGLKTYIARDAVAWCYVKKCRITHATRLKMFRRRVHAFYDKEAA